jgi:hypothetical protein
LRVLAVSLFLMRQEPCRGNSNMISFDQAELTDYRLGRRVYCRVSQHPSRVAQADGSSVPFRVPMLLLRATMSAIIAGSMR